MHATQEQTQDHIRTICDIAVEISGHSDRLTKAIKSVLVPPDRPATYADVANARRIEIAVASAIEQLIPVVVIDVHALAKEIAERSNDAYSFERYADWEACAMDILCLGFSESETEAILRSKWMRWAADIASDEYGFVQSHAIVHALQNPESIFGEKEAARFDEKLAQLVKDTFEGEDR